jgi:hypothetical protein
MLANKTELNTFVTKLALKSSQRGSELNQLRWIWLLQPSSASIGNLIERLESEKSNPSETTLELENTTLWISLFDTSLTHRKLFHSRLARFEKIENPETRFENLLVRYFIADRYGNAGSAQSLLNSLRDSFVSESRESPESNDGFFSGSDALLESIEQLNSSEVKNNSHEITINLSHWAIEAHDKRLISKPLCLFIELLRTNLSISFDELLAAAFDIPKYDESFHYQKVQNLISRLRVLSPDFVINTRQGRIYSSVSWEKVSILSMSSHQESLKKSSVLDLFLRPENQRAPDKTAMRVSLAKLKATLASDFSRYDFERVTGFPRSTASRFLKNWLSQDILTRSGAGKATFYNFK